MNFSFTLQKLGSSKDSFISQDRNEHTEARQDEANF